MPNSLSGKHCAQVYFNDSDYGGKDQALLEALTYRDNEYKKFDLPILSRIRVTKKRLAEGHTLAIYNCLHVGIPVVRGRWMETVNGKPKQFHVLRSCNKYGAERAFEIVENILREKVSAEAARLAWREANGCLQLGDGAVGSRRNRKAKAAS